MEMLSQYGNVSEKPATANQDSEERNQIKVKPSSNKTKIIKKKNKSKSKHVQGTEHNNAIDVKAPTAMAPFGIFQSQTQKCQRLQHYLRKDIQNFYKVEIQSQQRQLLENLLNQNLIQLTDIYNKDLSSLWRQKRCSLSQIKGYLQVINEQKKRNSNFILLCDQVSKKQFACFTNEDKSLTIYQLNQFQSQLLKKREQFFSLLKNSEEKFENKVKIYSESNGHHKMSQLSIQIAFLFKNLYDSTKILKAHLQNIKSNIQVVSNFSPKIQDYQIIQNKYITYLVKKIVLNALKDDDIDYLNFFKNNQSLEHNYGPPQASLNDQKQFQQFMRKKKNKKGRKGKYVLHTACLGCCSSYYQQYNPFSYCQECYVRFHRSCYTGYPAKQEIFYLTSKQQKQKDVLCQACHNKKINPNFKARGNQCDFCGLKGLLTVPAGQFRRIHVFCMLLNGLWVINNGKVQFRSKTDNKVPNSDSLKCVYCNSGIGYLHFCMNCQKYVHVSCAYFNGLKIDAQFDESSENASLKIYCCNGVPVAQNQKRRKFVTNYKKQAYAF